MTIQELEELSIATTNLQHTCKASESQYVLAKIGKWQVEGRIVNDTLNIIITDGFETDYPIHYGDGNCGFDFMWNSESEIVRKVKQFYKENS